jgi:hypothetical protein
LAVTRPIVAGAVGESALGKKSHTSQVAAHPQDWDTELAARFGFLACLALVEMLCGNAACGQE